MKKVFFLIILIFNFTFLIFNCLHSAEDAPDDTSQWESDSDIEDAYQDGDIDADTYENLLAIYDDKIDINSADVLQLQSLPGLTPMDASKIVNYRLKHGYYRDIKDLINPEILDEVTFESIKIFITAELPEKIKTKGDILFKTKSNLDVEMQTTEYPRTYDLMRLRLIKFGRYLRFGAIVEGDARYENYYYADQYTRGGEKTHGYRLNKSYIGYEKGPVINQMYLGNYRAGFGQRLVFDNSGKSSPAGLYPDDSYSKQLQTSISIGTSGGKVLNDKYTLGVTGSYLQGFGGRINQDRIDLTGFYSKAKYPLKEWVVQPDGSTKLFTLEDRYEETLVGSDLTYKLTDATPDFDATYIGTTLYTSKREALKGDDITVWRYPPEQSFAVYGSHFVTGFRGFGFSGEIAKVHGWGGAWYVKTFKKMGKIDMIYSHRNYDADFYNPWAKAYSKHYNPTTVSHTNTDIGTFRCRDEIGDYLEFQSKLSRTMKLKFYVDQFKYTAKYATDSLTNRSHDKYETPTLTKEIYFKYNWKLPQGVNIQIDRKWLDKDIYKNVDSTEKMTVTTNFLVKFRPSKVCVLTVKYDYAEDYYDNPTKYTPKDYIWGKVTYAITGNLEIGGGLKFADSDLRKSGKESREYFLAITDKLSRYAKVSIRFNNKYKWSPDEYQTADDYITVDPGYANKWEVRVDYKW